MILNTTESALTEGITTGTITVDDTDAPRGAGEYAFVKAKAADVRAEILECDSESIYLTAQGPSFFVEGRLANTELNALINALIRARAKARTIGFLR